MSVMELLERIGSQQLVIIEGLKRIIRLEEKIPIPKKSTLRIKPKKKGLKVGKVAKKNHVTLKKYAKKLVRRTGFVYYFGKGTKKKIVVMKLSSGTLFCKKKNGVKKIGLARAINLLRFAGKKK